MDEYLTQLYYNPKRSGSLGGVERLYRDVKKEGKYDISRAQLKKWLMKQDTYTLHKQARRHYKRNRVIVGGIDELWQMDLADMQAHAKENDGYRYLLVCIDVFSKYVWVIPLKNKTGPALVTAFKEILESGRKPQKIQTDEGTEFFNKHFKDLMKAEEIQLYNTTPGQLFKISRHLVVANLERHSAHNFSEEWCRIYSVMHTLKKGPD